MSYRKLVIGLALGACALVAPALAQQVTRIVVPLPPAAAPTSTAASWPRSSTSRA